MSETPLTRERRKEILDRFMESPVILIFSERLALDEEFREWANNNGVEYCILNFLSFLRSTKYGEAVGKSLQIKS
jgi:hypothetical protein